LGIYITYDNLFGFFPSKNTETWDINALVVCLALIMTAAAMQNDTSQTSHSTLTAFFHEGLVKSLSEPKFNLISYVQGL